MTSGHHISMVELQAMVSGQLPSVRAEKVLGTVREFEETLSYGGM